MPTEKQIEAAAQAIRERVVARNTYFTPRDWQQLPSALRQAYRDEAHAALRASELVGDEA